MPESLTPSDPKIIKENTIFPKGTLKEVRQTPAESEGFLWFPKIVIESGEDTTERVIHIYPSNEPVGTDSFQERDQFEKEFHKEMTPAMQEEFVRENQILRGETTGKIESTIGGRMCLHNVRVFVTPKGSFISMPIGPDNDNKYGGQAKVSGTSLVRGKIIPNARPLLKATGMMETVSLEQTQRENPDEKIISKAAPANTGPWTVKLYAENGKKYTKLQNCQVARDPETGTLDVFLLRKQLVFEDIGSLDITDNTPLPFDRANVLVSLPALKKAKKGDKVALEKLYIGNKQIKNLYNLPANYKKLFEMDEEGIIYLKEFTPTPPMKALLDNERKIIDLENVDKPSSSQKGEIQEAIGSLFEDLVAKTLNIPRNEKEFDIVLPSREKLDKLIRNMPNKFQEWVENLRKRYIRLKREAAKKGKKFIPEKIKPDFISGKGEFMEVKHGKITNLNDGKKQDQLFRMILYRLIKGDDIRDIYYLTLGELIPNKTFPNVVSRDIIQIAKKVGKKTALEDLRRIEFWKKRLRRDPS